jgi:putative transposase
VIQGGEQKRFAMLIPLRADFDAQMVRAAAKRSKDGAQARRLLALATIYEGATRTEAAKIGGVTLQIVRDWVLKFNALGPDGRIDRKPAGQAPRLNDTHRAGLAAIIESGPISAIHGVVRWRIIDLCHSWRGAMADHRSLPMDLRGIPRGRRQADVESRTARHGLSQASRSSSSIMPRPPAQSKILKKSPGAPGADRA